MLYHLLYPLHTELSFLNVFRYITFRTIYAGLTAFLIVFFFGPLIIQMLRNLQIGQYIREEGPQNHAGKAGTPTMGGVLIIAAFLISTLLWADLGNYFVWVVLTVTVAFCGIGFRDDYLKQVRKQNEGLNARGKFVLQILMATLVGIMVYTSPDFDTHVTLPLLKHISPDLGIGYILFTIVTIVGASNAVNLTDGLDGLAIGSMIIASVTYMVFAYVAGHIIIANYLQIQFVPGCGELTVICGAMAGAGLGFLWFNAHPAQIFMGDTGSLPLGAWLGTIAIISKQEILLIVVGGLFVIETLSVIVQVGYFKMTKGRRFFKMAPLHHHFELKGWPESKVIVRFWIFAILMALISLSTLKLR
jgi:phospho-N-acetylmuramoyl-pentapeptide-transferase